MGPLLKSYVQRRYLSPKAGVGQTKSRISRQTMRTPPASPDLQSPPSNPAQGTGPGHVNRGGSDNRDRGAKAGVTHHCGVVKEHAATADEEPSLKKTARDGQKKLRFCNPATAVCASRARIELAQTIRDFQHSMILIVDFKERPPQQI